MNKGLASPSDRATQASPEPASSLGHSVSVPDASIIPYGDYRIWYAPQPFGNGRDDWRFAHKDFTSEHDGDFRCGSDESEQACRQTIDYLEEEERHDNSPEGKEESEAFAKRMTEKALELVAAMDVAKALDQVLKLPGIGNLPGFATGLHLSTAKAALERYAEYHPHIRRLPAQGTEAGTGETGTGSTEGDGPVRQDAPNLNPETPNAK